VTAMAAERLRLSSVATEVWNSPRVEREDESDVGDEWDRGGGQGQQARAACAISKRMPTTPALMRNGAVTRRCRPSTAARSVVLPAAAVPTVPSERSAPTRSPPSLRENSTGWVGARPR